MYLAMAWRDEPLRSFSAVSAACGPQTHAEIHSVHAGGGVSNASAAGTRGEKNEKRENGRRPIFYISRSAVTLIITSNLGCAGAAAFLAVPVGAMVVVGWRGGGQVPNEEEAGGRRNGVGGRE